MRMAASEFYYKQPFDIKEEYPIMTTVLGFSLVPFYLIFVFLYARLYGSLERYTLPLIIAMFAICFGIAFLMIRSIKDAPFIEQTIVQYNSLDTEERKKLYSFKNGFKVTFIMAILPWLIFAVALTIICIAVPHPQQ